MPFERRPDDGAHRRSVRAEVRAWLDSNWDPDLTLLEWRNRLVDSGWGMPQWPKEWFGRELSVGLLRVIDEEFKRVDAITVARKGATTLAGQTILTHGPDMLKEKFLRHSLTGEDARCQLFSEPGNGSDLAGAMTRAEREWHKYIVNGQKVWTTSASSRIMGCFWRVQIWMCRNTMTELFHP